MSVLNYLQTRASNAVLSASERSSIATSIDTLSTRLGQYFTTAGDGIAKRFQFGSSTRGTILPRSMDASSDIDYMIVFEKGGFSPQTYLDRLRRFVEGRYSTSEIYQSNPTIVLELNHIKFDLVPALAEWGTSYKIPNGTSLWQSTNPNDFNTTLENANKNYGYLIKPTIRLAKIWNAANGYVYESYYLERTLVNFWYPFCVNQADYLFTAISSLPSTGIAWRDAKIKRAKDLVANVRQYERERMPFTAEAEVKKLIPE
ncbi:nucleotidyltransferase [Sinorhizobium medicae]|nr:nucleotidyltransferase [Sinorhizobium medicae]